MEETKKKASKLEDAKDRLIDAFNGSISKGIENIDAEEAGEVTDMIKDLAEAEKECWEACYYKSIVEAMDESKSNEKMGYDSWRYANGEFAPKGRGTRGYTPVYMNGDNFYDDLSDHMIGYTDGGSNGARSTKSRMGYSEDPIDELSKLWQEADSDTKHRMKAALEEMAHSLGE